MLVISKDQRMFVEAFCKKWRIQQMSVFGSAARGDATPNSDIDLLVTYMLPVTHSLMDAVRMQGELESMFHTHIDLLSKSAVDRDHNPIRKKRILDESVVIYEAR